MIILAAVLLAATRQVGGQAPIGKRDFIVAKLGPQSDSGTVRRVLGRPDSVTFEDHPFDVGAKLSDWWYPKLRVLYYGASQPSAIWILARGVSTARGLQVGDRQDRVRTLYGRPASIDRASNAWVYYKPGEDLEIIKIFFRAGRVASVFAGVVLD